MPNVETMTQIRFRMREDKAADAAAWLIARHGGESEYIRIIKLLYLADREALQKRGSPISGDRYVSMDLGPVLSETYRRIQAEVQGVPTSGPWAERIELHGRYNLRVKKCESFGALSEEDEGFLERIFQRFQHMTWQQIVRWTHKLPEWKDPKGSSIPIDPGTILRAVGWTDEDIRKLAEEERAAQGRERLLGC